MPNWNTNKVTIDANLDEVLPYFIHIKTEDRGEWWEFNMHLLFPDRFREDDPQGEKNWDYDWCVKNTGSKWFPYVTIIDEGDEVVLRYDSARTPNNRTLLKMSEVTGWWIQNEYEEEGQWLEGIYICNNGELVADDQGDFQPTCAGCEKKFPESKIDMDEESSEWICKGCQNPSP